MDKHLVRIKDVNSPSGYAYVEATSHHDLAAVIQSVTIRKDYTLRLLPSISKAPTLGNVLGSGSASAAANYVLEVHPESLSASKRAYMVFSKYAEPDSHFDNYGVSSLAFYSGAWNIGAAEISAIRSRFPELLELQNNNVVPLSPSGSPRMLDTCYLQFGSGVEGSDDYQNVYVAFVEVDKEQVRSYFINDRPCVPLNFIQSDNSGYFYGADTAIFDYASLFASASFALSVDIDPMLIQAGRPFYSGLSTNPPLAIILEKLNY